MELTETSTSRLIHQSNLTVISNAISQKIERQMTRTEILSLVDLIKSIPIKQFVGKPITHANAAIVDSWFRASSARGKSTDIQSYLRAEVSAMSGNENAWKFDSNVSRQTATELVNSVSSLQTYNNVCFPRQLVPFDSKGRLQTGGSTLSWNLNQSGNPGQIGDVWLQDTVKEILAIKIYPFWIPNNASISFYRKARLGIRELFQRAQATQFIGANSAAIISGYQFEFNAETIGSRTLLTPVNDTYRFYPPVAKLDSVSITLYDPFNVVQLPADSDTCIVNFGNPTTITTTTPHGSSTGDIVYFSGSLNAKLTTEYGLPITVINATIFTVPIIGSGVQNAVVYYGSRRIFFELEFTHAEK